MISVTELRKGTVFAEGGRPYLVLEYRHTKVGRGAANIKVKVKDLKSGSTLEKTFMSGASVEQAELERKKAQYLYSDDKNLYPPSPRRAGLRRDSAPQEKGDEAALSVSGGELHFMDPQSFEQFSIARIVCGDAPKFLKEGSEIVVLFFQDEPISIELPLKVELKVIDTPPGERGDTKQGGSKEATLETGYNLQVPLFVKVDDLVRINTETGDYAERV